MTHGVLGNIFVLVCSWLLLIRAVLFPLLLFVQSILMGGYTSVIDGCTTRVIAHCRLLGW